MMEAAFQQQEALPLPKLLLTVEDAAQVLSLGRTCVYELVMCKKILSVKIGGKRRIPFFALEEFVTELSAQVQK